MSEFRNTAFSKYICFDRTKIATSKIVLPFCGDYTDTKYYQYTYNMHLVQSNAKLQIRTPSLAKGFFHHLIHKISEVTHKQRGFDIVNRGYKAFEEYISIFSTNFFSTFVLITNTHCLGQVGYNDTIWHDTTARI